AGEAVAVGDADGGKTERIGRRDHLARMRSAAQEGKVGGDGELRIGAHLNPPPTRAALARARVQACWGRVGWGVGREVYAVDARVSPPADPCPPPPPPPPPRSTATLGP